MKKDKTIDQPKIVEPNSIKSQELKEILLKRIDTKDKTPIKMIETISGNRKVKKILYNFIPYSFETKHQDSYFEGSADKNSYKFNLVTEETKSALAENNPKDYQATIFDDSVVNFEL